MSRLMSSGGSGPSDEQQGSIVSASVCEYDVGSEQRLT